MLLPYRAIVFEQGKLRYYDTSARGRPDCDGDRYEHFRRGSAVPTPSGGGSYGCSSDMDCSLLGVRKDSFGRWDPG